VLAAAGLSDLFDARVDGAIAAQRGLRGKPDPDIFLEAARHLHVDPSRAIVIEDAAAGVRAGSAGGFLCTIGLARDGNQEALRQHGANLVVRTLEEIDVFPRPKTPDPTTDKTTATRVASSESSPTPDVRLASEHLEEIRQRLQGKRLAIFLDYDGTLTAIVRRPEHAQLGAAMRHTLERLAEAFTVAIVSGRDRADVKQLVGLDQPIYAGSHGFDISGPSGLKLEQPEGIKCLPELDRVEMLLRDRLDGVPEAQVERKRFAIAIHYRRVAAEHVEWVERVVDEVHRGASTLRKKGGKKIFELQPDVPWDKGRAVVWLLEKLDLDRAEVVPLYVGDDETDEDAFRALSDRGFGIVVQETPRATAATYRLPDPTAVQEFFEALLAGKQSPEEITG
jgi:alpha,alpha-trehalase